MTTSPDGAPERPRVPVRRATELIRELRDISEEFETYLGGELSVNPTDLQAMQHLISNGSLAPTELARRLGISAAATTAVVDRLVSVGHASRTQNPTDRRGIVIVPNPASVDRAMETLMPMIMGIDGVLDEFDDDDRAVITAYLERVLEVYRAQLP